MITVGKMCVEDLGKQGEFNMVKVTFDIRDEGVEPGSGPVLEYKRGLIISMRPEDLPVQSRDGNSLEYRIRMGR